MAHFRQNRPGPLKDRRIPIYRYRRAVSSAIALRQIINTYSGIGINRDDPVCRNLL